MNTEIEEKKNAIVLPDIDAVTARGADLEARVNALKIVDNATLIEASELLKTIAAGRKAIEADFKPSKQAANALHKAITAQENKYDAPWATADQRVRKMISEYHTAEADKRRREEARLAEEARRRKEEEQLNQAIKLDAAGKTEEAAAVLDKPVVAPPVRLAGPVKTAGVTMVTVTRYEIIDASKLNREFLVPDEKGIAAIVKSSPERAEQIVGAGAIRVTQTQEPRVNSRNG